MASISETPPVTSTADPATVQAKPRLNPARRRAAKLKAAAEAQKTTAALNTVTSAPVAATTAQPDKANIQVSHTAVTKEAPRAQLSRQTTEPTVTQLKPALTRSVTAPVATKPSSRSSTSLALTAPALVTGGLLGCLASSALLLGVGLWYDFSGAESAILAAKSAKICVDNLAEELIASLKAGTYSTDEALDMLRRTTLAYASTIPEGAPFVERVFREIDMVRKQRGREVDRVVAETYSLLQQAGKKGASPVDMRTIVVKQLMKLSSFASQATQDIVTRNPTLRPVRQGMVRSLSGTPESKVPTVKVNMAVRQKSVSSS